MNIPFLTAVLKRRARSRLRRIMRGYRFLKKNNQLGLLTTIQNKLAITYFSKIDRNVSKFFFGAGAEKAELSVRQYLLIRIGSLGLNKALLLSLGKKGLPVVYPMPKLWQQVVAKHGFSVARRRCFLLWSGYVSLLWGYGVLRIIKQIYVSLRNRFCPYVSIFLGRYAYFMDLVPGNIPQFCRDGRSHDIITWYIRWKEKTENLNVVCHGLSNTKVCQVDGLSVVFNPHPLLPLGTLDGLVRFIGWAVVAALLSVLDLFRGRWWHAMLLAESVKAAIARFQVTERLARDYLFHQSGSTYRPLWTYEVEKKGLRIIFYFYSTNCELFKNTEGYPALISGWRVMNWPLYLVWDEFQVDFLRRAVGGGAKIRVVRPIWFHTSSVEMPEIPTGSVAVFDVQPQRNSRYQILGASEEYYVPDTAIQFFLNIYASIRECKRMMVYKRKRHIGKRLHPKYATFVKNLSKARDVISIEPDIAVIRVIEGCSAVISMPFTSTALWGRELGKPSVYYDPFGMVQKDDRAAHGIQVLCGKDELFQWLSGLFEPLGKAPIRDNL